MEQQIICINCPVGCQLCVVLNDRSEVLSVSGNTCPRGEKYARQECTIPLRTVTAVIPVKNSPVPLSVKTSSPVPKRLIPAVMAEIKNLHVCAPVAAGEIMLSDVCGTGSDIISTRSLE